MRKAEKHVVRRKIRKATVCYCAVVRSFVQHYCGMFDWQDQVLGFVRARDFAKLLKHAKSVNSELIDSCTHAGGPHKVYADLIAFKTATQYVALIKNYQFTPAEIAGLDPEAAALEDFLRVERRNTRLNKVFAAHRNRGTERHWCIPGIREVFCRVLGKTPPYEDIFDNCDYSGGAAVDIAGQKTHMATKLYADRMAGNPEVLGYLECAIRRNFHYAQVLNCDKRDPWEPDLHAVVGSEEWFNTVFRVLYGQFKAVLYDEVMVVPKKADTGRTICKNTPANNFVQKGIDVVMRYLLKRVLNIDLTDQLTNQVMAGQGSTLDERDPYVTLDVSAASNSVLTELIRSVSPPRWFKLLDHSRSPYWMLKGGRLGTYQMFASMGNGFCFPLESLLFAAIVISASKHVGAIPDYRVYGDDIICRQSVALVVIECLKACGFKTNIDKTFVFGPFRESCGANWYGGEFITPGYIKERLTSLNKLHALHNTLKEYPKVQDTIRGLQVSGDVHMVPNLKCWSWITDQAFLVSEDLAMTASLTAWDKSTQSFAYPILMTVPKADETWQNGRPRNSGASELLLQAAVLRGSFSDEPFHLRRETRKRTTLTVSSDVAKQAKLIKKLAKLHPTMVVG